MEPIRPDVRTQLLRTYPDLDNADVDRYEELTSRRFALHPDRDASAIRSIDAERTALIQGKMPRLADIERAAAEQRRADRPRPAQPRIAPKAVPGEPSGP